MIERDAAGEACDRDAAGLAAAFDRVRELDSTAADPIPNVS